MAEEGWSELITDLLASIIEELPTADRARFRSGCTAWNSVPPLLRPPLETPCLLVSPPVPDSGCGDEQKNSLTKQNRERGSPQQMRLYSIYDNRTYKMSGRQADFLADCWKIVTYSPSGWLMYMDEACELQCLHLPTGNRIYPPSITTFRRHIVGTEIDSQGRVTGYYKNHYNRQNFFPCNWMFWFYNRGIIIFRGSPPDCMPTTEYNYKCLSTAGNSHDYIIVVSREIAGMLAFARQGDTSWTLWNFRIPSGIRNFILYKGSLYAVGSLGCDIIHIELNSDLSFGSASVLACNFCLLTSETEPLCGSTSYLVDIDGHLWLIQRYIDILRLEDSEEEEDDDSAISHFSYTAETSGFRVFKFDENHSTWVQKDTIGSYAIFVGNNHSLALYIDESSHLAKDCIYFTDDECESYQRLTSWNMGVYNLQDQTVNPYYDGLISLGLPQPTWVLLSSFYDLL